MSHIKLESINYYSEKKVLKMIRRIFAIITSAAFILSVLPVMVSAADVSATSLVSNASTISAINISKTSASGSGSKFTEWFIGLFGYFKIDNEAKLKEAAGKKYAHEYTLKKDLTLSDTVRVTGTLNLKGNKTIRCGKTCFDVCGNGKFSSKDIKVISENGEAIKNSASCTVYSGTYESGAGNAYVIRCIEDSATVINGGTFNNPNNTDLYIDGSGANVFWIGGEAGEACVKPGNTLYMTGGHIGTIYEEGDFVFDGGIYDRTVKPQEEKAEPKPEIVKPQEESKKPVEENTKPVEEKTKPVEEIVEPQVKKFEISSEKDLKEAAKEGGVWTVTADFTVDTQTNIECASLKIIGKGHTITMKNTKADTSIFNVISKKILHLSNLNLKNLSGKCVAVNTSAELIAGDGEKCSLESGGITVVNSGFTQLSYGTTFKTTGKNTVALKNNSSGKAELYNCNANIIENSGTLILRQSNSVAGTVTNSGTVNATGCSVTYAANKEGAVWNMSGGYIDTFSNHGKLSKTGGTIKTLRDNYLIYPTKIMEITQDYNGITSHCYHAYSRDNIVDFPIDEACGNTSRSYFYCPCDEMKIVRIYGIGTKGTNTIWLQSTKKVYFANGTSDYVTIMVTHPNDDTLKNLSVGQIFKRKEAMFLEGDDGEAYGFHFHIAVGKGSAGSGVWIENVNERWVLSTAHGTCKPEEAFFIDKTFTKVKKDYDLKFKYLPD